MTALLISIGVVVVICVIYWWLERTFDITLEDIAEVFIGVICFIAAVGIIYLALYIFTAPKEDLEHTREVVYEITSDNQSENQSECHLLGDSCIVEEWSPICLIQKCIIDTRK